MEEGLGAKLAMSCIHAMRPDNGLSGDASALGCVSIDRSAVCSPLDRHVRYGGSTHMSTGPDRRGRQIAATARSISGPQPFWCLVYAVGMSCRLVSGDLANCPWMAELRLSSPARMTSARCADALREHVITQSSAFVARKAA
jgi:hypothetical protein